MSDFSSSLPVRTEQNGDVAAKIVDSTVPSQGLTVNPDGSINITDNSGSLTVDAVNLDIRDLVFATDKVDVSNSVVALDATTLAALESITVQNGAGASAVNIQDGGNSITVDGTVELGATTLAALESITVQNPAGASAVNIQDGGNSITIDNTDLTALNGKVANDYGVSTGAVRVASQIGNSTGAAAFGNGSISAQTLRTASLITDGTDVLAVNTDGSINVVVQEDVGTETVNYNTGSAIAAGATSNHDLVFASASKLHQILATASGKLKITVQIETGSATGTFNTVAVAFNSTASPNIDLTFAKYVAIPVGARVRVIRQNSDNQAQDVYSTIIGILG